MPISPIGKAINRSGWRRTRGFSLIELMVVLAIMVIIGSAALVSMAPALAEARLRSGCRNTIAACHYARSYAVSHRTDAWVAFDITNNGLEVTSRRRDEENQDQMVTDTTTAGHFRRLPQGVKIIMVDKPNAPGSEPTIQFDQTGRAEQAQITLEDERGRQRIITLDALTGRCTVENRRNE
ncbi:MAG: GspH/FimT family pseudopilin [Armatimonadota bacterium]